MKKIVFTGGGSAGHVTPNLAIIPKLQAKRWDITYIGSNDGIEKQMIEDFGLPYHGISSGKLRRYFDVENIKDPFKVMKGIIQAYLLLRKLKPDLVFSKGGFVSVPVIMGSWLNRIPAIIHESDMTPGLANKIAIPFAKKVCVTFPEALQNTPEDKGVHTGSPIREEVLNGDRDKGLQLCGFHKGRPVLLIMGGSLGSGKINETVRTNLDALLTRFQIVHICGQGHTDPQYKGVKGYNQYEYVQEELPDMLAMTDVVISRAGSNSIFEFLALKKPMLLIPLGRGASRGDQILNAQSFEKMGYSQVLVEEKLSPTTLFDSVTKVYADRHKYISNMEESPLTNSVDTIIQLIEEASQENDKAD